MSQLYFHFFPSLYATIKLNPHKKKCKYLEYIIVVAFVVV